MKKYVEDEIFRGIMIALLGVDMLVVISREVNWFLPFVNDIPPGAVSVCVIIGLGLFAMIIRSAGHYRGKEEVTPNYFDRYPLEIYAAGDFVLVFCSVAVVRYTAHTVMWPVAFTFLGIAYLGVIFGCMSVAVRCKTRTLVTNTLIYRSIDSVCRFFSNIRSRIAFYISNLPLYWQIAAVMATVMAAIFICIIEGAYSEGLLCCFAGMAVLTVWLCRMAVAYNRIAEGTEKIASGDTEYQIDTTHMPAVIKNHAENLNSINTVVSQAVSKRIKSEQFRTELITNVSHDIKTPLTSIISYIDLMGKENITSQPMAEYISVLQRQSDRLKKLIDDLVEASKASTGNIAVHLATTGLGLLLNQAVGEYEEKAEKYNVEICLQQPEKEIYILSDGRLVWRIFDNLLSNACKYSQPGTRVYISLENIDGKAVVVFKNISKVQLNISPDELMERFVRGDSSRNTEGSGLGLSIAQSLTEILNGSMSLDIDGDMFKVMLCFDVI